MYCYPHLYKTYIALTFLLSIVCFVLVVHPKYSGIRYRVLRTILFICLGFSGVIPLTHRSILDGVDSILLFYLLLMGATYVGGAFFYLYQMPERFFPGKFDILFSSHQIWHLFVFLGTTIHFIGVKYLYHWRILHVCPSQSYILP
uniref:Adiponectin receptor protein 1 n=1 Tax=Lygus hesperus TaxID=30085 RepID=A0A0A9X428_LYGHE